MRKSSVALVKIVAVNVSRSSTHPRIRRFHHFRNTKPVLAKTTRWRRQSILPFAEPRWMQHLLASVMVTQSQHKAENQTPNGFLPTTRQEMDALGWPQLDILIITGDSYVYPPSFGAAMIGRVLEKEGYRVGIIAQPDWTKPESIEIMGRPTLFVGIT